MLSPGEVEEALVVAVRCEWDGGSGALEGHGELPDRLVRLRPGGAELLEQLLRRGDLPGEEQLAVLEAISPMLAESGDVLGGAEALEKARGSIIHDAFALTAVEEQ